MGFGAWIWVGVFVIGVIIFYAYYRTGRFMRCLGFTAATGLGALGVVWLLGRVITIAVTVTPLSIAISTLLGVPGVVAMLLAGLL